MIGMSFEAFLVVSVTAVLAAAVVHYLIGYRFLPGFDGFLGKVVAAWLGAWLGSPVLGHWFESLKLADIYLIPALLGAFVGAFVVPAAAKALAKELVAESVFDTKLKETKRDLAA
jgi:uncharacterized membrane protein YeaQ/YmgE (transglycosylase-associated protein family)